MASAQIWRYGNLELHFDREELFLIFSDYIDTLSGGDSIHLSKWILDDPQELTLEKVIMKFNIFKMDFSITHQRAPNLVELKILKSKVALIFEGTNEANANHFRLQAFSLMRS